LAYLSQNAILHSFLVYELCVKKIKIKTLKLFIFSIKRDSHAYMIRSTVVSRRQVTRGGAAPRQQCRFYVKRD